MEILQKLLGPLYNYQNSLNWIQEILWKIPNSSNLKNVAWKKMQKFIIFKKKTQI